MKIEQLRKLKKELFEAEILVESLKQQIFKEDFDFVSFKKDFNSKLSKCYRFEYISLIEFFKLISYKRISDLNVKIIYDSFVYYKEDKSIWFVPKKERLISLERYEEGKNDLGEEINEETFQKIEQKYKELIDLFSKGEIL